MGGVDNKKVVSLRINAADLDKVRTIGRRLRVRDSAVLRFAIKDMLCRLGPLCDEGAGGTDLIPMFIELGHELMRHFELDHARLEQVINSNLADPAKRVDPEDIALFAMGEMPDSYRFLRLREACGRPIAPTDSQAAMRSYLYDKYVNGLPRGEE